MPGGDPLATCTLPVGDVYLLTYLGAHRDEGADGCRGATAREFGSAAKTEKGEFIRYGMQWSPKHSATGTKARER